MNAVLILIIATAVLATISARFGYQPRLSALIAGGGAALMGAFVWLAPVDVALQIMGVSIKFAGEWAILGRTFVLDAASRPAVSFLYLSGAFLIGGAWMARASRYLTSVGLVMVSAIALSLLVQPFLYAAILLEIAAMGAVLVLVTDRHPKARGALRLLFLYTIAMMVILQVGRVLEIGGITTTTPVLAMRVSLSLALGFAILMAVPPFHLWLPSGAKDLNIYALAFTGILLQSAGLFLLLRFLDTYEWMRNNDALFGVISVFGVISIWFGSLAALVKREPEQILVYGMLTDFGATLLAVGVATPTSYQLALGFTGARIISLAVGALGLVNTGSRDVSDLDGAVADRRRVDLGRLGSAVGLLSIAGMPLTVGFPGRWVLFRSLVGSDPLAAYSLVGAFLAIGVRGLMILTSPATAPKRERPRVGRGARAFLAVGILLCVLLGLFPDLFYPWIAESAATYANLVP